MARATVTGSEAIAGIKNERGKLRGVDDKNERQVSREGLFTL